jgi:hypothetical protein
MKTNKSPCKDCLILPICRQKEIVICDPLEAHFIKSLRVLKTYHDTFMTLVEYLPKIRRVYGNERSFDESITLKLKRRKEEEKERNEE